MLILRIKAKWFDLIVSGEKKEEYRDRTPYYMVRIEHRHNVRGRIRYVTFINGYRRDARRQVVAVEGITIGKGRKDWGADGRKKYYVIHLGELIPFDMQDPETKPFDVEEYKRKEAARYKPKRRGHKRRGSGTNFTPPKKKRKKRG